MLQLIGEFTIGGAENMVVSLSNALDESQFGVFLSVRKDGPVSLKLKNRDQSYVIEKNKVFDLIHLYKLINFIRKHNINIIHAHLFGTNLYGFIAAKLTGVKIIQTIHGEWDFASSKRRLAYNFMKKHVDMFVVVSDFLETNFINKLNIPKEKICTIYNGIDSKAQNKLSSNLALKKQLGIETSSHVVGSIGNIKPVKGYEFLIQSAKKIVKYFPKIIFIIVGEVTENNKLYKSKLDKMIDEFGLVQNIKFLGLRSDISDILTLLDLFVMPSKSEGLSLALLEAMAAEKIIVTTSVGGNCQLIKNNKNGILIPPENAEALSDEIINVLKKKDSLEYLGANAKNLVDKQYSNKIMMNKYSKLYKTVVEGGKGSNND